MTELRQKMITDMKISGFSVKTQQSYLHAVSSIAAHFKKSPDRLDLDEIKEYLVFLKEVKKLSWSTRNVTVAALNFLYKRTVRDPKRQLDMPPRKRPKRLPEVLSRQEVKRLLNTPSNIKHRAVLKTTYSAGLRVGEVVRLRPEHIDSKRMLIRVEEAKGRKDRYTILSPVLLEVLRQYWMATKANSRWLFPSKNRNRHLHISTVQKVYSQAKETAGIKKGRGIHTLRHYAEFRTMPSDHISSLSTNDLFMISSA